MLVISVRKNKFSQALVAQAYNPSYSWGRDEEDCGSKTDQANSSWNPILKNSLQKRAGGVAQDIGPKKKKCRPEFKPQSILQKQTNKQRNNKFKRSIVHHGD
jgi:hypothetical protein